MKEVLKALDKAKIGICNDIGTFVVAEAQVRTVVDTGNLKRSETFEVMPNNAGIYVGVTSAAPYGIIIEKGSTNHPARPFLEPAVMDNISQLKDIAERHVYANMSGN